MSKGKTSWKVKKSRYVLENPWIKVRRDDVDVGGEVLDYYILEEGPDVIIAALTSKNELLFNKTFKAGIWDNVIELPAGYIDKGNTPRQVALSELREETGYVASKLKKVGELYRSPLRSTQVTSVFLAQDLSFKGQDLEVDEKQNKVVKIKVEKALKMIKKGEIKDMASVAAVLMVEKLVT